MCPAIAQAIFLSSSKATSDRSNQDLSKRSPTLGQFEVHESREQFFSSQLNVSKANTLTENFFHVCTGLPEPSY